MSVIWKQILEPTNIQDIEVPDGAELLTARDQHEQLCVWFKCEPHKPMTTRKIAICGTGHDVPAGTRYIGTCYLDGGILVFHVFEFTIG